MKKSLLHIVSLLICLSFAFQTSFAQVITLDSGIELQDSNESEGKCELNEAISNAKRQQQKVEKAFIIDKQELFSSDYATIEKYEPSFCISSYFQLYQLHNSYLI